MDSIAVIPPFQITKREEEGDEGEYWNMLECRHKGKIMLVLEGNWIAKNKISRITILSPTIRLNNIFVGQTIKNIRDQIDDKRIESAPDGILLLPIKGYKNIVLQMDISHISPNNPLWFGVYKVKTLPPNMRIQSIIITEDFINE